MCRHTHQRLQRAGLTPRLVRGSVFELPYPLDAFDTVASTFAFSGFPDGTRAMKEIVRVLAPGGRLVLIDIGLPGNGSRTGLFFAHLWERMDDFLYDQPALMQAAGLNVVTFQEFGAGDHIRAIVGEKPPEK